MKDIRPVGELKISRALEMLMEFDPYTFFPETTREDWEPHHHWLKPDAINPANGMLVLPCQSYIVRTSHHTILIDSCIGNHKERPTRPMWHEKTDNQYMAALREHELRPEDIDYVMCTHMHSDHIGWNTKLVDGRWVPTFPNARYIFSQKELDTWQQSKQQKFSLQPIQDSVLPVIAAGQAQMVSSDFALDDEVWLEPTAGHTPDHFAVNLASNGERAIMLGDMLHCPVQCKHPEWTVNADFDAEMGKQTRRRMLERLSEEQTFALTSHFPLPSAGHIRRDGDSFTFEYDKTKW
jgi:glyoxylase-like metal-dependent hydrolase (beta-lactamase superfamily II)